MKDDGQAVIDCSACVHIVKKMTRGESSMCEQWRAGYAPQAALKALCPLRTHQLVFTELHIGHAEYLIDTHNQLLLVAPLPLK